MREVRGACVGHYCSEPVRHQDRGGPARNVPQYATRSRAGAAADLGGTRVMSTRWDVAIIGGGIVGAATAMALVAARRRARRRARGRGARSPRTRPATTAASSTRASTTSPARSRRGTASRGARRSTASAPSTASRTSAAASSSWPPMPTELPRARRARAPRPRQRPRRDCGACAAEEIRELEPHVAGIAGPARARDRHRGLHAPSPRPTPASCRRAGGEVRTGARVRRVARRHGTPRPRDDARAGARRGR